MEFHDIGGVKSRLASAARAERMKQARDRLRGATPEHGAVKRAALDAGIRELGRFSVEYRKLFGESASATLTRAPD